MRLILLILLIVCLIVPVSSAGFEAPLVPESGERLMPGAENFGEGLMMILGDLIPLIRPDLHEASGICLSLIAATLLGSLMQGSSDQIKTTANVITAAVISMSVLSGAGSLIRLAADTIAEMVQYGKLLFPVLTTAMAAQGLFGTSAALFAATVAVNTLVSGFISGVLISVVYVFLTISVAAAATGEEIIKKFRDLLKTIVSWCMKTILGVFTAYMGITGVVSGTADAALLKATKITISTAVPLVGGILSEASEAVLISMSLSNNAAGIYGIFAILAIFLEPFLLIGCHYLMLKITAAVCSLFGTKNTVELIGDLSTGMGMLLAMTGSVCILLLISSVCFLKGVS